LRIHDIPEKQIVGQFNLGQQIRAIPNASPNFGKTDLLIWAFANSLSSIALASKTLIVHLKLVDSEDPSGTYRPIIEACVPTPTEITTSIGSVLAQRRVIHVTRAVGRNGGGLISVNHLGEQSTLAGAWAELVPEQLDIKVIACDQTSLCLVNGGDGKIYSLSFIGSKHLASSKN